MLLQKVTPPHAIPAGMVLLRADSNVRLAAYSSQIEVPQQLRRDPVGNLRPWPIDP